MGGTFHVIEDTFFLFYRNKFLEMDFWSICIVSLIISAISSVVLYGTQKKIWFYVRGFFFILGALLGIFLIIQFTFNITQGCVGIGICCNGTLGNGACCNKTFFNPDNETCCMHKIYSGQDWVRCGNDCYQKDSRPGSQNRVDCGDKCCPKGYKCCPMNDLGSSCYDPGTSVC
jgi:hypothetical protein